jgi:hypothetical protein
VAWAKGGSVCKTATLTFQRVLDNLDVFLVADYVYQNGLHSHLAWAPACVRMKIRLRDRHFDPLAAVRGLGTTKALPTLHQGDPERARRPQFVAGLARLSLSLSVWRGPARTIA